MFAIIIVVAVGVLWLAMRGTKTMQVQPIPLHRRTILKNQPRG
jgi:hypothetical protein